VSRYQGSESKPTAAIFVPDESEISYTGIREIKTFWEDPRTLF